MRAPMLRRPRPCRIQDRSGYRASAYARRAPAPPRDGEEMKGRVEEGERGTLARRRRAPIRTRGDLAVRRNRRTARGARASARAREIGEMSSLERGKPVVDEIWVA